MARNTENKWRRLRAWAGRRHSACRSRQWQPLPGHPLAHRAA